jgi:hypothetical protein
MNNNENPLHRIVDREDLFNQDVREQLKLDFENINKKSYLITDIVKKINELNSDDMDMLGSVLYSKNKEYALRLSNRIIIETNF